MNTTHDKKTDNTIILLFEDEKTLSHSIRFTLMRMGYHVAAFDAVEDGMNIISGFEKVGKRISLIITDLQLRGKSGFDLIRMINESGRIIPVLVITGHGVREVRDELAKLGVHVILDKPFCVEELVDKVKILIEN